jgi:hypothetical protein
LPPVARWDRLDRSANPEPGDRTHHPPNGWGARPRQARLPRIRAGRLGGYQEEPCRGRRPRSVWTTEWSGRGSSVRGGCPSSRGSRLPPLFGGQVVRGKGETMSAHTAHREVLDRPARALQNESISDLGRCQTLRAIDELKRGTVHLDLLTCEPTMTREQAWRRGSVPLIGSTCPSPPPVAPMPVPTTTAAQSVNHAALTGGSRGAIVTNASGPAVLADGHGESGWGLDP